MHTHVLVVHVHVITTAYVSNLDLITCAKGIYPSTNSERTLLLHNFHSGGCQLDVEHHILDGKVAQEAQAARGYAHLRHNITASVR